MSYILGPKNWLLDDNKELSLWTEVLSLVCQLYGNYKLAIVSWLPLVAPDDPGDDAMQMLIDWRDENDNVCWISSKRLSRRREIGGSSFTPVRAASLFAM